MTLHIVGLGPGGASLLTQESAALLAGGTRVILRTRSHPAVAEIAGASGFLDCDDLDGLPGEPETRALAMAERVLELAAVEDLIFAVPGDPLMGEPAVTKVIAEGRRRDIQVIPHAAVGYLNAASLRLATDLSNAQLCDARELRIDPQRPALVSRIEGVGAAARLRLDLLRLYPADHRVSHLPSSNASGNPPQTIALGDLEVTELGPADQIFVPALSPEDDVGRLDGLVHIVRRLQSPDGCPWDREQTHESLRHHLLEECYECLEAIDSHDRERIVEELGDVLLQVLMHTAIAERAGSFSLSDVSRRIARKLIYRHPHVFADVSVRSAEEAWRNWDVLKRNEKPLQSVLDGVPESLPALAASQALQSRARRSGFDWPDVDGPLEKLEEEIGELARAGDEVEKEDEFGDVLFVITNIAEHLAIDAEQALRGANAKFRRRFGQLEMLAVERGLDLAALDLAELDALWDKAKELLGSQLSDEARRG